MGAHSEDGGATRRRFFSGLLLVAAQTSLFGWPRPGNAAQPAAPVDPVALAATFAAFLDTLLPRDDVSPSASELGLPGAILKESVGDELYTRLIRVGCLWLDRAAEGSFAAAPPRVHEVIVTWMADSDWDEVPRRFYELIRQRAVELYYSRPEAWAGLAIARPPQPVGYPDHWT